MFYFYIAVSVAYTIFSIGIATENIKTTKGRFLAANVALAILAASDALEIAL